MAVGINDPNVQQLISEANKGTDADQIGPPLIDPPDTVFRFAAGYFQDDGTWATEFEVRELTGRDEEALARITDVGRSLVAMIERGIVRLGNDAATPERLDSLIGGDWDTVLLAVRAVTFGPTVELRPECHGCGAKYEVTINLLSDLPVRTANQEDLSWTVKGRRHTYDVSLYTGATQRRVFDLMAENKTIAAINTEVLSDSIDRIDGMPVLGKDVIRDLPMADRRTILDSIQDRRVGPDFQGVTIKCPTCSHEQPNPLNAAALFQWN
jgi:hypothetical protein